MFKPIEQTPRYKLVARQIADLILSGRLAPGTKMPTERELVDELGVSRSTVREALIVLEVTGFVENSFGGGAAVSRAPPASSPLTDVEQPGPFELLEARLTIEGEVAYIAAKCISRAEIARLKKCVDRMQTNNSEEFWRLDEEFHVAIATASQNTALAKIVRDFWRLRLQMPMCVRMTERANVDDVRGEIVAMHRRIIDALEAHDSELAKQAIRSHLGEFGRALLAKWNQLDNDERSDLSPPAKRLIYELT